MLSQDGTVLRYQITSLFLFLESHKHPFWNPTLMTASKPHFLPKAPPLDITDILSLETVFLIYEFWGPLSAPMIFWTPGSDLFREVGTPYSY